MARYLEPAKGNFKVELTGLFGGEKTDITQYVSSASMYSSIEDPFMSMSCTISDENAILADAEMNGEKALIISIRDGSNRSASAKYHINSLSKALTNNRKAQAVEFTGFTPAHLNNSNNKAVIFDKRDDPVSMSSLIGRISQEFLGVEIVQNQTAGPEQYIDIVRQSPLQAISMCLARAGSTDVNNSFVFYEKLEGGKPMTVIDEVSRMARQDSKWTYYVHETQIGENDDPHAIDKEYVSGASISKVINYQSDSLFNVRNALQMGFHTQGFVKLDYVNKTYEHFQESLTEPAIGKMPMEEIRNNISTHTTAGHYGRTRYQPHNGDASYYVDPRLEFAFAKRGMTSAGMMNQRQTITSWGCMAVAAGDVVELYLPTTTADPARGSDETITGKYLVLAIQHSVTTNGEVYSKLEIAKDGE